MADTVLETPGAHRLNLRVLRFRTEPQREEPAMLAQALLDSGRFEEAIELTARALARDPADVDVGLLHGVALSRAGRLQEAQRVLARAADSAPEWVEPWRHLAELLLHRDRPERALAVAERGLVLEPHDEALSAIRRGALLSLRTRQFLDHPDDEEPALLAQELIAAGRFEDALEVTRTALVMEMDDVDLLVAHAHAARAAGDLEEALGALSTASFEAPDYAVVWRAMGDVQVDLGRLEDALTSAQRAMTLAPRDRGSLGLFERVLRAIDESPDPDEIEIEIDC